MSRRQREETRGEVSRPNANAVPAKRRLSCYRLPNSSNIRNEEKPDSLAFTDEKSLAFDFFYEEKKSSKVERLVPFSFN